MPPLPLDPSGSVDHDRIEEDNADAKRHAQLDKDDAKTSRDAETRELVGLLAMQNPDMIIKLVKNKAALETSLSVAQAELAEVKLVIESMTRMNENNKVLYDKAIVQLATRDAELEEVKLRREETVMMAEQLRAELERVKAEAADANKAYELLFKQLGLANSQLDWLEADMKRGDDSTSIEYRDGAFRFPYLVSNAGGFGGGVGEYKSDTLREAITRAAALNPTTQQEDKR